jgi:3-oxoadipate enol-lactonase
MIASSRGRRQRPIDRRHRHTPTYQPLRPRVPICHGPGAIKGVCATMTMVPAGGETRVIRANGHRAHVRLDGPSDGPTWVFANALGTDLRVWDPLAPHLPGKRLVRYDKRGHGLSEATPGPYTMTGLADDLAALLDALALKSTVVVGLSIGGMIALALAGRRPELVRGLVLMDTAPKIGTKEMWQERIATVEAEGVGALAEGTMARWFPEAFRRDRPDDVALWRTMLERTPAAGYAACGAAIRDADLEAAAAAVAVPTLCVVGEHDGSTPPDVVRGTAAAIPGAEFELIPDAGHLPQVVRPDDVARCFARFETERGLS